MANENHRVDKYQYELIQDTIENCPREMVVLFLYDERREMLCNIAFVPNDQTLIKATRAASGQITAQLHIGQLDRLLDMLRNEKPIYFSWSPEAESIRFSTSKEPVGEQELRRLFSFLYV